ncbi:PWWP domain [Spatholobus suberectus]|nr:PWWP domain [Spatholobus suberectus]
MGSSGESNLNGIDASVGGLVWVRRRNGSWWPGRIMGLHELSESCLVSPRSGTPVKLLGREDASVDWYNLEKSKRVKAFRCGEYDECIEKAKASAANSNKKAVKYARREDAILHALELESAHVDKEPLSLCSRLDKPGSEHGGSAGELLLMSNSGDDNEDATDDLSDSDDNSNSAPELSQSGISFEEPNHNGSLKMQSVQGRRRRTPNDSEDDGSEGVKRMRGLEDLGIGVVSKRKVQGTGATEIVQHISASLNNSTAGNCLANGTSVNGGKGYSSTLKRKRSQVANAHELLKRRNRRRPLTKVLESTAMVSVPVICDQLPSSSSSPLRGVTDGRISGLDSNDSKKTFAMTTHNSDSTEATCENGTSLIVPDHGSDASQIKHGVKENETSGIPGLVGKDSPDKLFDVPFVGVLGEEKDTPGFSPVMVSCSSGKPEDSALGQQSCNASQCEAVSLRNEIKNEPGCTSSAAGHNIVGHKSDKGSSKWQSKGKRNSRYTSKNIKQLSRKYEDTDHQSSDYLPGIGNSDGFYQGTGQKADWNGMGAPNTSYNTSKVKSKPVAEGQLEEFRDLNKRIKGTTAEAKLLPDGSLTPQRLLPYRHSRFTVNSRYQMADFPGRNYCSDASLYDVKLEVKSSYRPQHVPLVSLVSKLNGKAFIGHPLTVEVLDEGHCDKMLSGIGCDLEASDVYCVAKPNSVTGRIHSKNSRRFSPSKSSKMKKAGLLNKKIRKLSSLTGHRQSEEERKPVVDKLKGPVIACIPLQVVFSRINEAVSGQARSTHRALPTSNP